jgi:hypothetical protein
MLTVKYDPTRNPDKGQYYVELSMYAEIPDDMQNINRFGYWCDLQHLLYGIVEPINRILDTVADKGSDGSEPE